MAATAASRAESTRNQEANSAVPVSPLRCNAIVLDGRSLGHSESNTNVPAEALASKQPSQETLEASASAQNM